MSRKVLPLTGIMFACVLILSVGCQEQNKPAEKPAAQLAKPGVVAAAGKVNGIKTDDTNESPIITFEKEMCDFGDVGPDMTNVSEFKFTNTGKSKLRIKRVQTTCGCTVADLAKLEYAPGESGVIKISYKSGNMPGVVTKQLFVLIDDEKMSKVQLSLRANIVIKIKYKPERLSFMLKDMNVPDIKVYSTDKVPFAIKGIKSSGDAITADYDPNVEAVEFIIKLKPDIAKLQKQQNGSINIELSHPQIKNIGITFTVMSEFNVTPPSIIAFNVEPNTPIKKEIWILNNYDENFEIESVTSQAGTVKVLNQEKIDNRYKLTVELMPPSDNGKKVSFVDTLNIAIKGGKKLDVNCRGFYLKEQKK